MPDRFLCRTSQEATESPVTRYRQFLNIDTNIKTNRVSGSLRASVLREERKKGEESDKRLLEQTEEKQKLVYAVG